jgi:hypothetical protein
MNTTSYEKGQENGRRELVRDMLEEKFGPLSAAVLEKLDRLSAGQLKALAQSLLRARSLRELGLED